MEHKGLTEVEFLQVIDGQSFVIRCRHCDGTGSLPTRVKDDLSVEHFAHHPCGVCAGKGMLRLTSPDIPVNCGTCHGTGRTVLPSFPNTPTRCPTCQGFGVLALTGKIKRITG